MILLLDGWTDRRQRNFYCFSVAFVDENWETQIVCLGFKKVARNDSEHIAAYWDDLKAEFDLQNKTFIAVTDQGSPILKFLRDQNINRISCIGHQIHNFVCEDILLDPRCKPAYDVILKVKTIVRSLNFKKEILSNCLTLDAEIQQLTDIMDKLNEVGKSKFNS